MGVRIDPSGLLSVTIAGSDGLFDNKACGAFTVNWKFELSRKYEFDVYVVLMKSIRDVHHDCDICPANDNHGNVAPADVFWEAARYPKGVTIGRDIDKEGKLVNSCGYREHCAVIKVFPVEAHDGSPDTGDLGTIGRATKDPKNSDWTRTGIPITRGAPATRKRPDWWGGTPLEGPGGAMVFMSWCCCNDRYSSSGDAVGSGKSKSLESLCE